MLKLKSMRKTPFFFKIGYNNCVCVYFVLQNTITI